MNPVVNLVVMATGDLGQLRVHHIQFSGIILPCITMRITDAIEQPGGCVAYLMDQSIPESVCRIADFLRNLNLSITLPLRVSSLASGA